MLNRFKILKRIQKVIPKGYKKTSLYFLFLSLLLLILDIFSVFLLIPLIISLLDYNNTQSFLSFQINTSNKYLIIGIIIVFFLIKNYVTIIINRFQAKKIFQLGAEYSLSLSKHYLLGNYLTFKQQKKSAIVKDIIFVSNDFVVNVLLSMSIVISEIIMLFFLCLVALYYNYVIAILIVIVIVITIFFYKKYNRTELEGINKSRIEDFDNNISNLNNLLNGYLFIKSSNMLEHFLKRFHNSNQTLNSSYAILHAKRINSAKQTEFILVSLLCFTLVAINIFIDDNVSPVIFLSVFGALLFKSIPSVNKLNIAFTNLNSHLYTLDIMEEKTTAIAEITKKKSSILFRKNIYLKNISFGYEEEKIILDNINITIEKGKIIGISGTSGIGKTTLLNIIAKLINPLAGEIFIDDIKITEENKYPYFDLFMYLTQKPFIYEGTILDNLLIPQKNYNIKDVNLILKSLKLEETINQLPNKLQTYIGADAGNLSAGQLQLLCIARAILNKPEILILDEATNNLDENREIEVLKFVKSLALQNNITIISVSHNMQKTQYIYDKIIVLENN